MMLPDMRSFFIIFAVLATAGCGGGGGAPSASIPAAPSPSPSPTAPPAGALSVSQSTAAFTAQGQSATVIVSEPGYTGTIDLDIGTCAPVATVTPAAQQSAPASYTLTAQGAGACTITFADRFGQHAAVAVGVTLTQGSIK